MKPYPRRDRAHLSVRPNVCWRPISLFLSQDVSESNFDHIKKSKSLVLHTHTQINYDNTENRYCLHSIYNKHNIYNNMIL